MTTAAEMRKKVAGDPTRQSSCRHASIYWYPAPNDERGWLCVDCGFAPGEEPGYSPEHDRDLLHIKVWSLLNDLADAQLVSVSNSSHGDSIVAQATRIARDARTFDQESLVAIIAKLCAGDGKFWREQHEAILAGKDNRDRCRCGKLATSISWRDGKRVTECSEHWTWLDDVAESKEKP